jgi:hypothetical protein
MGNSSSTPPDSTTIGSEKTNNDDEVICLDCDKKNQKDLPADDSVSQKGQPCAAIYETVTECMGQHKGQITSCTKEWESFRTCHQQVQQQGQQP